MNHHNMKKGSSTSLKLKILLLVLLCLASCILFMSMTQPDYFRGTEFDVRIVNGFTNNSSLPLVIWCSSKDGEMGGRALQEGDDFGWTFKTKYFWDTSSVFSCTMKWDQKRKSFNALQVGHHWERKCFWVVKEDGFYFSNDDLNWKKLFSWS
ncbi:S-protein homolog 74-like [Cornus florida]|uniref:S-protein homolog 74-like n=1 Tax=Cornus florida TaxID=4283 RepID=UPI0028992CF0|nr:S-protein homolog 74-like [Cornus florida]